MDIQKEREVFERLPLAELAIKSEYVFYNEETNSYWPNEDFCPSDAPETMNFAWEAWQAAKAQAVPEGFVLVSAEQMSQWGHMANCAEEYGCPECYESRGYAHSLACEINAYFNVGEAQEPAND